MSEFVVRPFAFMRLTHDALRGGFASLRAAANAGDIGAAASEWRALSAVIALHMKQEDQAFFPLLDALFDEAVTKAGLHDAHRREGKHEAAVRAAFAASDLDGLRQALDAWAPSFEAHLSDEEDVMMPLTEKVAPTFEGRAAAVREILEVDWAALNSVHLPYVVRVLAETKPYGPVRMFVASVQAAAGPGYVELEPAIRGALPGDLVSMLVEHGHLGQASA